MVIQEPIQSTFAEAFVLVENQSQPLIDIITPFRNASRFIPDYVTSLKSQTYSNWRAILVDDCSVDHGMHFLRQLTAGDSRFLFLSLSQHPRHPPGPAYARNLAIRYSTAPHIAFHDIDDFWHSRKLQIQLAFHYEHDLDISVTGFARFNGSLTSQSVFPVLPPNVVDLRSLLHNNPIPMLTTIINRSSLTSTFPLVKHEDYALWLRLFANSTLKYGCVPQILAFYRIHDANTSGNALKMPIWTLNVFRNAGYSLPRSLLMLFMYVKIHLIKLFLNRFCTSSMPYSASLLLEQPPVPLSQDESSSL